MILISGCQSKDDVTIPAQSLRDSGVELYAIGVFDDFTDNLRAGMLTEICPFLNCIAK